MGLHCSQFDLIPVCFNERNTTVPICKSINQTNNTGYTMESMYHVYSPSSGTQFSQMFTAAAKPASVLRNQGLDFPERQVDKKNTATL